MIRHAAASLVVMALAPCLQSAGAIRAQQGNNGLLHRTYAASPGYTLFAPLDSNDTFLVDLEGRLVQRWTSAYPPGQSVELLADGRLMRAARDPGDSPFRSGGEGGRIEEFDWDGTLLWTYVCCDDERRQHHDFELLPNGNVLLIAWEAKSPEEAVDAGRDFEAAQEGLWPDCVLEIEPTRPVGGKVVWEWHVWDHLIQDRDPAKPCFGVIAEHPERIDLNAGRAAPRAPDPAMSDADLEALRKLGYVGDEVPESPAPAAEPERRDRRREGRRGARGMRADWNHLNSVHYSPSLDQIVLSSHNQHEIWIIDHGTTTAQAATGAGGARGRGGDLLYRWGNPANWHGGTAEAQQLHGQHDARFIAGGLRGAGRLLVFNNNTRNGMGFGADRGEGRREGRGDGRPDQRSSHVLELELPLLPDGSYQRAESGAFPPERPVWRYGGGDGEQQFFSPIVSGAQRLPNGGTLITSGSEGLILEISEKGELVWKFKNPFRRTAAEAPRAGAAGGRAPAGPAGMMAGAIFRAIRIAPDDSALKGRLLAPIEVPRSR